METAWGELRLGSCPWLALVCHLFLRPRILGPLGREGCLLGSQRDLVLLNLGTLLLARWDKGAGLGVSGAQVGSDPECGGLHLLLECVCVWGLSGGRAWD